MRAVLLALMLLLAGPVAVSSAPECGLPAGKTAVAVRALDGETLLLADGARLRLLGVLAPRPPAWWRGPGPWPVAAAAREALDRLVRGNTLSLHFDGPTEDRHGRLLAQVFLKGGEERFWLQGRLVAAGHLQAYAFAEAKACAAALLARESEARSNARGLWRNSAHAVRPASAPDELLKQRTRFALVEGRVSRVGRSQRWRFLNFGAERSRDFTVAIAARDDKAFAAAGLDLAALAGARLRVRGWIERWNGPAIKVTHPDQIEILQPPPLVERARRP